MINQILKTVSKWTTSSDEVLPDILLLKFTIVNAFLVGDPRGEWSLVDTGLENSYDYIVEKAEERFGSGSRPQAIILTHGHFDHIGSAMKLAEYWDVPAYAHSLEMPYITGRKDYPQGDSSADEGAVAKMSPAFPHKSVDLGFRAVELPTDGSVPGMPGWKWIHTPGHTKGHVSLFRTYDRTLIVGDAFTTTKQESLLSVLTQREQIKGPPAYLTPDWHTAKESIEFIRTLKPVLALPSHGKPMSGEKLHAHLRMLTENFSELTVPDHGKFIDKRSEL